MQDLDRNSHDDASDGLAKKRENAILSDACGYKSCGFIHWSSQMQEYGRSMLPYGIFAAHIFVMAVWLSSWMRSVKYQLTGDIVQAFVVSHHPTVLWGGATAMLLRRARLQGLGSDIRRSPHPQTMR